jgi:hypothetical protein
MPRPRMIKPQHQRLYVNDYSLLLVDVVLDSMILSMIPEPDIYTLWGKAPLENKRGWVTVVNGG